MKHNVFESTIGHSVSRETFERLEVFAELVRKWNSTINIISKRSLDDVWTRHLVDSAQVYYCARKSENWVDLGSGGGFPGAVVAILDSDAKAYSSFTLVESDQRKAAFLRTVSRETSTDFSVVSKRIEQVEEQNAQILSARALTALSGLLEYCDRHLAIDGTGIFPKGISWKKELLDAQTEWNFQYEAITSITEPEAVILKVREIARA